MSRACIGRLFALGTSPVPIPRVSCSPFRSVSLTGGTIHPSAGNASDLYKFLTTREGTPLGCHPARTYARASTLPTVQCQAPYLLSYILLTFERTQAIVATSTSERSRALEQTFAGGRGCMGTDVRPAPFVEKRGGLTARAPIFAPKRKRPDRVPYGGVTAVVSSRTAATVRNPAWIHVWAPYFIGRRVSIPLTDERVAEWGLAAHHTKVGFGGTLAFNPAGPSQIGQAHARSRIRAQKRGPKPPNLHDHAATRPSPRFSGRRCCRRPASGQASAPPTPAR